MTGTLICTPMRIEARFVRRGLSQPDSTVLRTGYGYHRAVARGQDLRESRHGSLVVMGVGGGLTADLSPGDIVVATRVGDVAMPGAALLAGELRRAGLTVHLGPVVTVD